MRQPNSGKSAFRRIKRSLVNASAVLALAVAGCYPSMPPSFNARDAQVAERMAANEDMSEPLPPLPTRVVPPTLPTTREALRPTTSAYLTPTTLPLSHPADSIRLSLQQIIHMAVLNSLDVRVAGYQPGIDAARVTEAEANFDPTFFTKYQYQYSSNVQPSISNPTVDPLTQPLEFTEITSSTGFKQTLENGAQVQLSYDITRADRNQLSTGTNGITSGTFDRFYTNMLTFQITQPLLQNYGHDANYARIAIAKDTQVVSLLDYRLALEKNMADIEQAYWQLAQSERELQIRQKVLDRARDNAKLMRVRLGQGATNLEVAQADAAVASREVDLLTIQQSMIDLSNQLKSLINDPSLPVSGTLQILCADQPVEFPVNFDPADVIKTALENRAELAQQQARIDSAEVTLKAAWNNLLPTLNLTASVDSQGDGAKLGSSFDSQGKFRLFDWAVGLELDIPLGNRAARSIYRRIWLQRQQSIDQYKDLMAQVTADVKKSLNAVQISWRQVEAARKARLAAAEVLGILDDRIIKGAEPLSPPIVETRLQLQSDLANAESQEITALANYNVAISALERSKGTLLKYNNVTMVEQNLPRGPRVDSRW